MSQRQTLTNRIVNDLIQKHGFRNPRVDESPNEYLQYIWQVIRDEVEKLNPATLGIIIANGPGHHSPAERGTSLYSVHCGTWLSKYDTGRNLLRDIAATTIVAIIYDRLKAESELWTLLDGPEFDFLQED